jgi:DegV family protein with EDD domain
VILQFIYNLQPLIYINGYKGGNNMSYVIITDSTCSLTEEEIKESGVKVIQLSFSLKGQEYKSNTAKDIQLFYNELRKKENATTSCINYHGFIEIFEEELIKGNDLLYVSFSSALSSTYQNSVMAMQDLKFKYPERKIICVDSLMTSYGLGMLLYQAGLLQKQGKSIEEVETYLNNCKLKATALFTVEDLFYLCRGGRVKLTSYLVAKTMSIKPLMHMDKEGRLVATGKVIGRKKAILSLVERLVETIENPEEQEIYIGHGDCIKDVELAIKLINQRITVKGYKINYIDPVVGVHSGPGTLALFYFANDRA